MATPVGPAAPSSASYLANFSASCNPDWSGCVGNEAGYPTATVVSILKPRSGQYPFTVRGVGYTLWEDGWMLNASMAHEVVVWVQSDVKVPDANPIVLEQFSVAAEARQPFGTYSFNHILTTPITLEPGERLYVGVQLAADDDSAMCLVYCSDSNWSAPDEDYWSDQDWQTYIWDELDNFGIYYNLRIWARG